MLRKPGGKKNTTWPFILKKIVMAFYLISDEK